MLADDERTRPMFDAVTRYALCGDAPLLQELGLSDGPIRDLRVRFKPVDTTDTGDLPLVLEADCP